VLCAAKHEISVDIMGRMNVMLEFLAEKSIVTNLAGDAINLAGDAIGARCGDCV
jgi:hypothetical protein